MPVRKRIVSATFPPPKEPPMNAIVEQLKSTADATKATDIRAAFAADSQRLSRFSVSLDDLQMDVSKTAVNDDI
ncbi:glucose-6-phosphate isomerase, partial [Rhizobium ruizarguesonis]